MQKMIAINRRTGKLYSYDYSRTTNADDFLFNSLEEFQECIVDDYKEHEDDYLIFDVRTIYKPTVGYEEVTDGELY